RRLHDLLPGSELAPLDRGFQHGDPDAVLDRIVRVEPLVFDEDCGREPFSHATEPDERRAAVGANDSVVDLAAIPEATGRVVAPRGAPVVEPSARHGSSRSCVGTARPCTGCDPHRERRSRTANGTNGEPGGAEWFAGGGPSGRTLLDQRQARDDGWADDTCAGKAQTGARNERRRRGVLC